MCTRFGPDPRPRIVGARLSDAPTDVRFRAEADVKLQSALIASFVSNKVGREKGPLGKLELVSRRGYETYAYVVEALDSNAHARQKVSTCTAFVIKLDLYRHEDGSHQAASRNPLNTWTSASLHASLEKTGRDPQLWDA